LQRLLAGKGQELAGELRGALGCGFDLDEPFLVLGGYVGKASEQLGLPDDGGEQVVEIVGDPAGQVVEAGGYYLDGLLIQLQQAIDQIGARRVSLDTLDILYSSLSNTQVIRGEIGRLFDWLREKGVTAIITGERGKEDLTRYGFEEYISDCVVFLDHRIDGQISKRRLRVVKYRGSAHGADEYPFLIGSDGISVFPITSVRLEHEVGLGRVSSGVPDIDGMLGGVGYFRASTVLVTGKAGTGKSSLSAAFARAACARGERTLYLALEESPGQLVRNMKSIGVDLQPQVDAGLLRVEAYRPTLSGLEEHLVSILKMVEEFEPASVVVDPITNFVTVGSSHEVHSMLMRLLDYLKGQGITLFLTALVQGAGQTDHTETSVSSLVDTWLALEQAFIGHYRLRQLHIIKSRGMEHSHEARELVMSSEGLSLRELPEFVAAANSGSTFVGPYR